MGSIGENEIKKIIKAFNGPIEDQLYWKLLEDLRLTNTDQHHKNRSDPFALIFNGQVQEYYFPRGNIEEQLGNNHNQIILGLGCNGASTTCSWVTNFLESNNYLVVSIDLKNLSGLFEDMKPFRKGKLSPLDLSILPYFIFYSYWTKFICTSRKNNEPYFQDYRKDLLWMQHLRFFYQKYARVAIYPTIESDFELMRWLEPNQDKWPGQPKTGLEILQRLLSFITQEIPLHYPDPKRVYKGIVVLVDQSDQLDLKSIEHLLKDFDNQIGLQNEGLRFKLFLNTEFSDNVYKLDCVRKGVIQVFDLPQWSERDVKNLLFTRPLIYTGRIKDLEISLDRIGKEGLPEDDQEINWTRRLVPKYWNRSDHSRLFQKLIVSSLRAYDVNDIFDVPYHALALTRGLLSLYAGVYASLGLIATDVNEETLDRIFNMYWETRRR